MDGPLGWRLMRGSTGLVIGAPERTNPGPFGSGVRYQTTACRRIHLPITRGDARSILVAGRQHQMHMIGHQYPSQTVSACLSQQAAIQSIVRLFKKRLRTTIPTLGHVVGQTRNDEPRQASQIEMMHRQLRRGNNCTVTVICSCIAKCLSTVVIFRIIFKLLKRHRLRSLSMVA